jgi:hypothetical protein
MRTVALVEEIIHFATCVPPSSCVDGLRCHQKEGVTLKLQYPMLMRKQARDMDIM